MAWQRPKFGLNPRRPQDDISNSYDGDLETSILFQFPPGDEWVKEFRYAWDSLETTMVRVYLSSARGPMSARVRVSGGDLPDTVMLSGVPDGVHWIYFIFPARELEAVSIDFKYLGDGTAVVAIREIEAWITCSGPLAPICGFLSDAGGFFSDLADYLEGWAIVGDALSGPSKTLAGLFATAAEECCEASELLQDILDALKGGITWDEISALILEHWPNLFPLIEDPVGYISGIVSGLIPELPDWLDDPVGYISEIVSGLIPELPDWLDDPVGWLATMLEENFPLLYYLVIDPEGELLYLIAQLFTLTPYQAQSAEFVVKSLFERYFPSLYQLWRDMDAGLWEWLVEKYEDAFEGISDRLYSLAENTIRFFWEGRW